MRRSFYGIILLMASQVFSPMTGLCQSREDTYVSIQSFAGRSFLRDHYFDSDAMKNASFSYNPSRAAPGGIIVQTKVKNRWNLQYGIFYSPVRQRYRLYIASIADYYEGGFRLEYMKVPVQLQYDFIKREKTACFVSAGIQTGLLISEDGAFPMYNFDAVVFEPIITAGMFRNVALDGTSAIGWRTKLYRSLYLIQMFSVNTSLIRIDRRKYRMIDLYHATSNYVLEARKAHTSFWGVSFGFGLKI